MPDVRQVSSLYQHKHGSSQEHRSCLRCTGLEIGLLCRAFRINLEIARADDWTNEESNMNFLIEGQGLW